MMIQRKLRGQAALEFLMTYGWAILVVLVAVGALAYFGVLSPDKFLPAKCSLQAGIACLDHKVTANSLQVVFQNSLGFDVTIDDIKAGKCTPGSVSPGAPTIPSTMANGEQKGPITLTCNGILAGATKYNEELNLSYTVAQTGISHNNRGVVTTRIE